VSARHIARGTGHRARCHRLARALLINRNRIAQKFHISAGTYVRDLDGQGLIGDQSGRVECHLGDRRSRGIDRLEGNSLLLPGCYHDLARHAFDAQQRGSRRAVLTIDDRELSARDKLHDDRGEARPRE
jgi:hypothetical protein